MFASCCEFLEGAFIFTGTWSRPTERKLEEFRLFAMETWCLGDDGGLSSVSLGLFRSAISSSRAALLVAIKSPNLKTKRYMITSVPSQTNNELSKVLTFYAPCNKPSRSTGRFYCI